MERKIKMEQEISRIKEALKLEFINEHIFPNEDMDRYAETIIEVFGDFEIDGVSEVIVYNDKEDYRIIAYINHGESPEFYINYGTIGTCNHGEYVVNSIFVRR